MLKCRVTTSLVAYGLIGTSVPIHAQSRIEGTGWLSENFGAMTPEELNGPMYAPILAEVKGEIKAGYKFPTFVGFLIHAGDKEVLADCLTNFRKTDADANSRVKADRASTALIGARAPWLIPLVAEDMFRSESAQPVDMGESMQWPLSQRALFVIQETIQSCAVFADDTRAWAKAVGTMFDGERDFRDKQRKQMRLSWRANEKWIKAGEYGKARPITEDGRIIREDGGIEPVPVVQAAPSSTPSPAARAALLPAAVASRHSNVLYIVTAALAVTAAVGLLMFFTRR